MISALKTERGLALQDLLTGAYEYIEGIDFPPAARVYLLDHLATTECVEFSLRLLALDAGLMSCFVAVGIGSRQAAARRSN